MTKKYVVEGIGAFFMLTALLLANAATSAPLAAGAMYAAMIAAGISISGAHYNPAVSLALLMSGKMERREWPYYLLAQTVGAILAAFIGGFLLSCQGPYEFRPRNDDAICAILSEFLGAFALVYVWLSEGRRPDASRQTALSAGLTLTACMFCFQSLSGGIFNPALTIGLAVAGTIYGSDIWMYVTGSLLGAAAAASVFAYIEGEVV